MNDFSIALIEEVQKHIPKEFNLWTYVKVDYSSVKYGFEIIYKGKKWEKLIVVNKDDIEQIVKLENFIATKARSAWSPLVDLINNGEKIPFELDKT